MSNDLEPAKAVLRGFLVEKETARTSSGEMGGSVQACAFSIEDKIPVFDSNRSEADRQAIEEEAYIWLYGEPLSFRSLMHPPKRNPVPEYYQQPAIHLFDEWLELNKSIVFRGAIIPEPSPDSSLLEYFHFLENEILYEGEGRAIWMGSLKSFLQYIREDLPSDLLGYLDTIFPYRLDIRPTGMCERIPARVEKVQRKMILKNPERAVYPIDIHLYSQITKNLLKTVLEGRSNVQRSAAETLGLVWICHAAAAARVMTREDALFNLETGALIAPELGAKREYFKPEYYIRLPTILGMVDAPISRVVYCFLLALPRSLGYTRILSLSLRALHRTLQEKGVAPLLMPPQTDNLTFLTLMSQPHHAIGNRYTPPSSP